MIINHNLNAMNAHRSMGSVTGLQGKAMEKLSSGQRINRAGDDAAGLAISEKMRSQIRGLNQASRNAQDGVSMIQTAEGALSETQAIGQRMRELAVQSANGTYTDEDRKLIDQEFGQLKKEIDRIADETEFNGSKVLNGDKSGKSINVAGGTTPNPTANLGNWKITGDLAAAQHAKDTPQANDGKKALEAAFTGATTEEEIKKLGEGDFELKISVGGKNKKDGSFKDLADGDIRIELIDKSKFNEKKEYVMDEVIIKKADAIGNNTSQDIELYGVKFNLKRGTADGSKKDGLAALAHDDNTNFKGVTATISFKHTLEEDKKTDGVKLQVGANENQNIGFDIDFMRSRELGLGGIKIDNVENAQEAIKRVDEAVARVSSQRADLGAAQNRLEHTIASTDNTAENLQAAESRIRDVDMAKEMMNLTKLNVLQQASQAMLSQANQAPQQVLSILR